MNYFYQYVKFKSNQTINFQDGTISNEFILSTQQADLGYGSANRKIFNKGLSIGDIRYSLSSSGLQQVQNTTISFSNVGQFYHLMRELNSQDFWNTLEVSIYWATGRVPSLAYDGVDWLEDGENVVSFTPSISYPLTDSIKKEFEGGLASASISKDKVSLSLVSKSKQSSYLIGNIESFNGADSSRALINPIVVGDLTDDNAFIPLILKNPVTSKSVAICSDIDLLEAPTAYIYDDENEKFHNVINDQNATNNNKQIEFYNESDFEQIWYDNDYVTQSKTDSINEGSVSHILTGGEVVGYFTDSKDYVIFSDYSTPLNYYITDTTDRLRDEGARDINNEGKTIDGWSLGYKLDQDMTIGIAKINLSLHPINLKSVDAVGTNISNPSGANLSGFLEYTQDQGGANDFKPINDYQEIENGAIGSYKNILEYREDSPRATRTEPNYTDAGSSLWLSAHARGGDSAIATDWTYYNYNNKLRMGITATFENFKFDSNILDLTFRTFGGVYKNFEQSSSSEAFDMSGVGYTPAHSLISVNYDADTGGTGEKIIHNETSRVGEHQIDDTFSGIPYATLADFYNSPPVITFNGWTTYQPVKSTTPFTYPPLASDCYLDVASPSFFGSTRFALDGFRVDAQVKANVESKYWCFKGKTGDNTKLLDALNLLSSRYGTPTFLSGDALRDEWLLSGVHIGDPIYFRDILAKIADEFRVVISDKNGFLNIVALGSSSVSPKYTIDESNVFAPFNDNIKFKETSATEIYNKIVIRYAKNHMTKRFGKTIALTANDVKRTFGVIENDISDAQSYLQTASNTLAKIGITEKTKTIDLDWVRDDYTANEILKWWSFNSSRQRAKITAEVSKVAFIDANIGDVVNLDLPSTPEFYQVNYQIMQINNKSSKKYSLELEEIQNVEVPSFVLDYLEHSEISMLTADDSNGQKEFQLIAYDTDGNDVSSSVSWFSNSSSVSVSSTGLLTANSASGGAVSITASHDGVTRGCTAWAYATIPSWATLKNLRGGRGGDDVNGTGYLASFACKTSDPSLKTAMGKVRMNTYANSSGTTYFWRCTADKGTTTGEKYGVAFRADDYGTNDRLRIMSYDVPNRYDYLGRSRDEGTKWDISQSFNVNGSYEDGIATITANSTSGSDVSENRKIYFPNILDNLTFFSASTDLTITDTELDDKTKCEFFGYPQNYIRYTDTDTRTDYVEIINLGTKGKDYNFASSDVPSQWFTG
jgi:hypothetical protein